MNDYMYNPYVTGNQFNNSRDFESGFMTIENPFPGAFVNVFTNPKKKSVSEIRSEIENTLTAAEYKTLIGTRFISGKDAIIKYRDILTKLINAGVFDEISLEEPSGGMMSTDPHLSDNDMVHHSSTVESVTKEQLQKILSAKSILNKEERDAVLQTIFESNPIVEPMKLINESYEWKPDWSILNTPKIEVSTVGDVSYHYNTPDELTTNASSPVEDDDNNKETSKSEPTDPTYPYTGSYIEITLTPSDKKEYDKMLHDINEIFVGNGDYIENFLLVSSINRKHHDKIVITLCLDCFRDGADTFARLNKVIENVINESNANAFIRFRYTPPTELHATELVKFAEKSIKILVYMTASGDDVILAFPTGINRSALKQVIFMCIDVNNALKNNK